MPQPPETLAYAANDPEVIAPWRRGVRFRWVPAVAIAMFLLALLQAGFLLQYRGWLPRVVVACGDRLHGGVFFPILTCFVVLLLKRRGAKRLAWSAGVLVVLIVAAAFPGPGYFGDLSWWNPGWDEFQAAWYAGAFVVLGACWHPGFPEDWRTLGAKLIFAAICIWLVMIVLLDADDWFWIGNWKWLVPGFNAYIFASYLLIEFVYVVLAWGAITVLCRMPRRRRRGAEAKVIWAMILAAAVGAGAYPHWGREAMAGHWLASHGSEGRESQLTWDYFLSHRPSRKSLLALVGGYPWPTVAASDVPRLGLPDLPIAKAIHLLEDDPAAVGELAKELAAKPNAAFAELVAGGMARQRCYAAAPLLFHFALYQGGRASRDALLEMGIPQAAWALLYRQNSYWSDGFEPPTQGDAEMAKLLGVTAKRTENAWLEVLAARGVGRHAPIPDAVSDACDREVATFRRDLAAIQKLQDYWIEHPAELGKNQAALTWKSSIFAPIARGTIAQAAGLQKDPFYLWTETAAPADEPAAADRFARDVDAFLAAQAAGGVKAGGGSSRP